MAFVTTGRKRLPSAAVERRETLLSVDWAPGDTRDQLLLRAGTCSSVLHLAPYSSKAVLKDRLLTTVHWCKTVDGDGDLSAAQMAALHEAIPAAGGRESAAAAAAAAGGAEEAGGDGDDDGEEEEEGGESRAEAGGLGSAAREGARLSMRSCNPVSWNHGTVSDCCSPFFLPTLQSAPGWCRWAS